MTRDTENANEIRKVEISESVDERYTQLECANEVINLFFLNISFELISDLFHDRFVNKIYLYRVSYL